MPISTTYKVVSPDNHTEITLDSKTDQPEQDLTESLSENEELQEPQADLNVQLTTPSYHKAPNTGLKKNMTVSFKTHHVTKQNHGK